MKNKINLSGIAYSVGIALMYLLFDRSLNIYYISSNSSIASLYTIMSEGAFVAVCLYFVVSLIHANNISHYNTGILFVFFAFSTAMFISTIINEGNVRRWFSTVYPTLGSLLLISICCADIEKAKKFIKAVSNLYFLLFLINFILMVFKPGIFGAERYFVSIKNQIAIPLTFGFFFTYIDSYLNGRKIKLYLYFIIHIITSVLAFSSAGLICMAFIYVCIFAKPVGRLLKSLPLIYVIIIFAVILLLITRGSISILLNLPIVKYIIVDVLGKNLTLTNRVYIWEKLLNMLSGHFILGKGVADTVNLFEMNITFTNRIPFIGTYSAHNQFLQTLYEGGIISLSIMLIAAVVVSRKLKKAGDADLIKVIKIAIVAIVIVLFDEAAGYIAYFQIIQLACLMLYALIKDKKLRITQ